MELRWVVISPEMILIIFESCSSLTTLTLFVNLCLPDGILVVCWIIDPLGFDPLGFDDWLEGSSLGSD